jgi:hypothetical protein
VEAKRAEMIGDEVQASEAKDVEGREDRRFPQPNARVAGNTSESK